MDTAHLSTIPNGARFRRADLHVHSHGASFDVKDAAMTPEAIVETAQREGLEIVAIADHDSIEGVERALKHAEGRPLMVVPAVELTTTQGHLLVYMPSLGKLRALMGKLSFNDAKRYCTSGIEQCLEAAHGLGGFGIAAHIEVESGFDRKMPGYTPVKSGFLSHRALLALEIKRVDAMSWYTLTDAESERARLAQERRSERNLHDDLPKVMNSDAHSLSALGRNTAGDRRVTRLKLDELSFDALRIALIEGAVRCRVEEDVPASVPRILGVTFDGGFLDGQTIHFNSNLTCIIGGRGTGKSTILENVRAASGNDARFELVDSEVGADTVTLWHQDETGSTLVLERNREEDPYNPDDMDGPTRVAIESFGQGETAETIQHCGKDPQILASFLDRFLDIGDELERERELLVQLEQKANLIERLATDVKSLPRYRELHQTAVRKIETLKKAKATEIIELEAALANEKLYCAELEDCVKALLTATAEEIDILEYVQGIDDSALRVGREHLTAIRLACDRLQKEAAAAAAESKRKSSEFAKAIRQELEAWRGKEKAERAKVEVMRKELEAAGMQLDMLFVRKLAASAAEYEKKIRNLTQKSRDLKQARAERRNLVQQRLAVRSEIYTKRAAFATVMSRNLAENGDSDFRVTLRYRQGALSQACAQVITETMQWRTSRVPRADELVRQLTVPGLIAAIEKRDSAAFASVKDFTDVPLFSAADQEALLTELSRETVRAKLEACGFEDLPAITVQGHTVAKGGQATSATRSFSRLSLGQQQSIILSMLLFSNSKDPLIIDQPEDNLDSLFIAKVLVPNLRKIKERRQVIIVTHNANIAVLSDAELIVPLRATSARSTIADRGSIDTAATQAHVCRILEGGVGAFRRRAQIYSSIVSLRQACVTGAAPPR